MNKYDLEHVTARHQVMSAAERQGLYRRAFELYYSPEHIERILRRAKAAGVKPGRAGNHVLQVFFTFPQEKGHPLQSGLFPPQNRPERPPPLPPEKPAAFFRRKIRQERRPGLPRENPVVFYPRRVCEVIDTHVRLAAFYWSLHRIRKKVERDPRPYIDPALIPVPAEPLQTKPRVDAAA